MAQIDDRDFLLLPNGTKRFVGQPKNKIAYHYTDSPMNAASLVQFNPRRNERHGFIVMPLFGSRWDDVFLTAVTKGTFRGSGITPIVDGEAANVIRRLQMMAYDWVVSYKSPFRSTLQRTATFFAMAEDGQGSKKIISDMAGALLSMNTGYCYAQLPFCLPLENWSDFGGQLEPILDENGEETNQLLFSIDHTGFVANRGLWSLDNLQIDPTGDTEFPLRIRKTHNGDTPIEVPDFPPAPPRNISDDVWVLIHKNYVGQVLGEIGAKNYNLAGFWTCPLFTYFGEMGVMNAMLTEYNLEGFFNAPPQGMAVLTGADDENQLHNIMKSHEEEREEKDSLYFPGTVWVSIMNGDGQIFFVPFKKPSEGFDQQEFIRLKQRRLALAMGLSLNFVTLEIGVGAVHQAAVADMIAEITGISFIRNKASHLFNHRLAPRRVRVTIAIPSSAGRLQQADTFGKVADGIKTLQEAGASLSENQVRKITEKMTGNTLPEDEEGDLSMDDSQGGDDLPREEPEASAGTGDLELLSEIDLPDWVKYMPGTQIVTLLGTKGVVVCVEGDTVTVRHGWGVYTDATHEYATNELFFWDYSHD